MFNIAYFRISNEDDYKHIQQQKKAVVGKYELNMPVIYNADKIEKEEVLYVFEETGSAYDLEKIHKRIEFKKIVDFMFSQYKEIWDIFKDKKNKEIRFFVLL